MRALARIAGQALAVVADLVFALAEIACYGLFAAAVAATAYGLRP